MKQPAQPWEFRSKPAWQRLIVMLGGIVVNVIVGIMIFIGITYTFGDTYILKDAINESGGFHVGPVGEEIGLKTGDKIVKVNGRDFEYFEELIRPATLLTTDATYTVERDGQLLEIAIPHDFIQKFNKKETAANFIFFRYAPVIGRILPESVAEKMGLKQGDKIVSLNGTPIAYYDEVTTYIKSAKPDTLTVVVQREGQTLSFTEGFKDQSLLGIGPEKPEEFFAKAERQINYGFIESIPLGTERAFTTLAVQVKAFGKIISGALSPKESLSGPLGIMQAFGVEWDWERFWSLTGVLSLVLAFMNLLPIPALDGGHVMFLSYEIISRRKPSDKFLETAQKVGMVFLLGLMVFIFANDIIKMVSP
jgi:regulator of sigma E protease